MLSSRFKYTPRIPFSKFVSSAFATAAATSKESTVKTNERLVLCSPFSAIDVNLAIEEALIRAIPYSRTDRVLFLYMNRGCPTSCVVVGRHQNIWSECNMPLCRQHGVHLQRRHSGGGTVYHDHGTLCMSFLTHKETYAPKTNMKWLDAALRRAGLLDAARHESVIGERRDDLFVNGKKLSGSAMRIALRAAYHHCTLLVNSDLEKVSALLRPDATVKPEFVRSRASASVRSPVANLSEICQSASGAPLTAESVAEILAEDFVNHAKSDIDFEVDDKAADDRDKSKDRSGSSNIYMLDDDVESLLNTEIPDGNTHNKKAPTTTTIGELRTQLLDPAFTFGASPSFGFKQDFGVTRPDGSPVTTTTADITVEKGVIRHVNIEATVWNTLPNDAILKLDDFLILDFQKFVEETIKAGLFEASLFRSKDDDEVGDDVQGKFEPERETNGLRRRVMEQSLHCYDRFLSCHLLEHDSGANRLQRQVLEELISMASDEEPAPTFKDRFCSSMCDQLLRKMLLWL